MEPTEDAKRFGLKNIETHMLQTQQEQYFAALSNFLSFIAMERLAYQVTEYTKFKVDDDTLIIWEEPQQQETPPAEPTTSVSTSKDNK